MVSASVGSPAPSTTAGHSHAPLTLPTRSLGRTIAVCEDALPTVPERRRPAGSGLAAAVPTPPVYHSLSIVPVGVVTPPGGHGPASGLPAPRRRAHRAPPGHRRAPGGLPARGGGSRRRRGPESTASMAPLAGGPDGPGVKTATPRAWSWAALMHRAFGIGVLACAHCGGRLRLIATLHDPAVIRKILAHRALSHSGQSPGPGPPESGAAS